MLALFKKSAVLLDECLKSQDRREELRRKAEEINKQIADQNLRSPGKKDLAKEKLQKQLKSKFDITSTEMNMMLNQFSMSFKESLDGAKHYQSVVNGIVLVGFDKLAHVYKEWGTKLSIQNFPKASEKVNTLSILEMKLEGIPTSWVHTPPQEQTYDQYMQALDAKRTHSANTTIVEDIARSLLRQKESLKPADCAKIDVYIMHLMSASLTESEESMLDNEMGLKIDQDSFVSYFLLGLNYQLMALGKQNVRVNKRTFIGLKNKFLLMLSSRVRVTN
jgi:hypothetical protein